MKKVWKWIIGIAVALVVLAVIAGVAWMFIRPHMLGTAVWYRLGDRAREPWMMMPYGHSYLRGSSWMFPFGGIFGGLFGLGILTLVVLGIIWLARRVSAPQPSPAAPQTPVAAAAQATCKRCGKPVEAEWVACPHCGKKL